MRDMRVKGFWSWVKDNRADLLADLLVIGGLVVLCHTGQVGTTIAGGTLVYMGLFHGRLGKQ